jgi:imidazolonepropionase
MPKVTLVRGARQLLTLRGPSGPRRGTDLQNLGIIQDGAVLIADGLIVEVGSSRRVENLAAARDADEIDASGCVVMPGFVDSDIHLVGDGHELSARALKTVALRAVEDAIRYGTTSIDAKSGPGLAAAGELKMLRVHAALQEFPFTFVSTLVASDAHLLAIPRTRKLADFVEILSEDDAILGKARQLGWRVKRRASSTRDAIATAVRVGAIGIAGLMDVTEQDAILLARSPTLAALTPVPSFLANQRYAPARTLIDNGAAIALASGAKPANMQTTIALACRGMNMTAAEAIAASTINGAHAIGRAGSVGSIEAGKSADLVLLGLPDYRELPYHLGVNLVNLAMIRGTVRVERSEVKWPDR